MELQPLVEAVAQTVRTHELEKPGAYARWLWQNEDGSRKMGSNEYGCADAANILYTIGRPITDSARRAACIAELQQFQNPQTGLFFEGTHHPLHCTAHCSAALELFDAKPLYRLTDLQRYKTKSELYALLDGLDWENTAWSMAHRGAGIFAAMILNGEADRQWQDWYFDWLYENADPEYAISRRGAIQTGKLRASHHLYGWFHYLFNCSFARRPFPYAEQLVDTCIALWQNDDLDEQFGRRVQFAEMDWIYALNRASMQTGHRRREALECIRACAGRMVEFCYSVDVQTDESWNDLHMLFGLTCALAELQLALPGELRTDYPLRSVLDRRPFI